jgi:hypothetical protein
MNKPPAPRGLRMEGILRKLQKVMELAGPQKWKYFENNGTT